MTRPYADQSASGSHYHHALLRAGAGDNAFFDAAAPDGLSPVARHWATVAGRAGANELTLPSRSRAITRGPCSATERDVTGTAQLLRRSRERGRLDAERLDRYLATIERTSDHLATLTEDLLDVSRLQHGTLPLRLVPTDLAALVREVTVRQQTDTDAHRLVVHIDGEPIDPEDDRDEIVRALEPEKRQTLFLLGTRQMEASSGEA